LGHLIAYYLVFEII